MKRLGPEGSSAGWGNGAGRILATGAFAALVALAGCASNSQQPGSEDGRIGPMGEVLPPQNRSVQTGLTVLLNDSIRIIAGKRVGLITNHT